MDLLCAPALHVADLVHLKVLTEKVHEQFCQLYLAQDENIKPKRHYSVYYPGLTKKFWSPFPLLDNAHGGEASILQIKGIFHQTNNRKNMCKTMAEEHQQRQALLYESENYLGGAVSDCIHLGNVFAQLNSTTSHTRTSANQLHRFGTSCAS